jgi:predicted PurR-regulated permease PerM
VAKISTAPGWQRAVVLLTGTVVGVVVFGALYWAQVVFIPVALAIFLAFLMNPLVRMVQRRGLGRIPSVIVVVFLAALVLGGLGWLIVNEVASLTARLPDYTANIQEKIKSLRELGAGSERLEKMIDDIRGGLKSIPLAKPEEGVKPTTAGVGASGQPATVVMQQDTPSWLTWLPGYLGSAVAFLVGLGLALILVVFMLLSREDLRNRFLRLVGNSRMSFTTKAVDEAGHRISRYLLMQLVVNGTYGLALSLGLWVLDVEHALLWGFLAAVLRYVPYIGPWIAALFPITLSLAMSEGWFQPLAVMALFLVFELVSNNVMEPWLYGHSMGVSAVAQLVSAAFWTFLWGPIGLVLSAPLTVCLLVLGKHVPHLGFLEVLLGDEAPLAPDVTYYQRLLARDQDDAAQLVLDHAKASPPEQVCDDLLVPALTYARRDRERDEITEADEQFVLQGTREIMEDLGERRSAAELADTGAASPDVGEAPVQPRLHLLVCPARDEVDRLAAEMLRPLLDPAKWQVEVAAVETLTAELVTRVAAEGPALVCIAALPPGGLAHTRYLCKRLRARLPGVHILVGRWGLTANVEANREQFREAGADQMATTLLETRRHLSTWLPVLAQAEAKTTRDGVAREGRLVAV